MSIASAKMPVAVVTGVICLFLGVAGGVVLGEYSEMEFLKKSTEEKGAPPDGGDAAKGMPAPMAGGKGMPGGKGGPPGGGKGGPAGAGGAKGGGKGGGFPTPSPKTQLAQLVGKLDTLTKKPLAVELKPEQKKQVKELLADLDSKEALSDEDAKAKLDALLKLVEGQKETLEMAGYRWPGSPNAPPGDPPANPFKTGEAADRLKTLRDSMGK